MRLTNTWYRCSAMETFDSVALRVWGNERYACELLCANPALCRIPVFRGGEELRLPEVETQETATYPEPQKAPWK